jgi:hypothetical protein
MLYNRGLDFITLELEGKKLTVRCRQTQRIEKQMSEERRFALIVANYEYADSDLRKLIARLRVWLCNVVTVKIVPQQEQKRSSYAGISKSKFC